MKRRTRKQLVGKQVENAADEENEQFIHALRRLVRREWWSQRRGQVPASEVLELRPVEDEAAEE